MPTVGFVNEKKDLPIYQTARRPGGVDFVIFVGSGYGNPNAAVREGTTHYTLDGLSGDVIAAVDVEDVAATWASPGPAWATRTPCRRTRSRSTAADSRTAT